MKTILWFMREYRHEDQEGKYYLTNIVKIWLNGAKYGCCVGLIPSIIWWILR